MKCPYCYVPFDNQETNLSFWKRIIDRIREWSPLSITFAGGDPFKYKDFLELLKYSREVVDFVQVDTNGLNVTEVTLEEVVGLVDLLGLPLDSSSPITHKSMRNSPSHFGVIKSLLPHSVNKLRTKINTVVSKMNIGELPMIREFLRRNPPEIWSLYEFWPIESGLINQRKYEIPHEDFLKASFKIRDTTNFTSVEIGSITARKDTYFFVRHTGDVYTVNPKNPNMYLNLGSIFDDSTIEAWKRLENSLKMKARIEKRISLGVNARNL